MHRKAIGYVVSHGHIDIEWYMPMRSYRFWIIEALDRLCRIAREYPDFPSYVLDGSTYSLDLYLEARPEKRPEIAALILCGKLVIGPFFTQFDEWLPCAESIIRNCLYGNRRCREFGKIMKAGYLPDNFGHPLQMPQILRNFGLDSLIFMRGMPEMADPVRNEFYYAGLDGSQVLACHTGYSNAFNLYANNVVDPMSVRDMPYYPGYLSYEYYVEQAEHTDQEKIADEMIRNTRKNMDKYPSGIVPVFAGCDHCPPQAKISGTIRLANAKQQDIEFVSGDAEGYVRLVQKQALDWPVSTDELIGSFDDFILLGVLSTRSYLKRLNFGAEALMVRYAEPLTALASLLGLTGTRPLLDEAWRFLMLNSTHDSIHGSCVDEVHQEMETRFAAVNQTAAGLSHEALKFIGQRMDPWWESLGKGILAFAPADPGYPQLGQAWLPVGDLPISIRDRAGIDLPVQVIRRKEIELNSQGRPRISPCPDESLREVLFLADSPANAVSSLVCVRGTTLFSALDADDGHIENEFLRVDIHGAEISILDKATGIWNRGLNLIEEGLDAGDAWNYSPAWLPGEIIYSSQSPFTCSLLESGPVRAVIACRGNMNVPARLQGDERSRERTDLPICLEISLTRYARSVHVRLILENRATDHRLRLVIRTGMDARTVLSQSQFGMIERPVVRPQHVKRWAQPPTAVLPFREWLAVQDHGQGLAVAVRGLYDYEAETDSLTGYTVLYLTLLRGVEYMSRTHIIEREGAVGSCFHTPGAQCLGRQVIEWAYVPYQADTREKTPFLPTVQSYLYPMAIHQVRSPQLAPVTDSGWRPFEIISGGVQFSSFKRSYDENGYILRFFENQGRAVQAVLRLTGFTGAYLSDMNEQRLEEIELQDQVAHLAVGPYQVVTLLLVGRCCAYEP
jgi:mannosylglycerate hydrolase